MAMDVGSVWIQGIFYGFYRSPDRFLPQLVLRRACTARLNVKLGQRVGFRPVGLGQGQKFFSQPFR